MKMPDPDNIFDTIFPEESFAEVSDALGRNLHCGFDFKPFSGESLFAQSLSKRLRKDFIVFHVDLQMVTGIWHFAIVLARALVDAFEDEGKKAGMIKRLAMGGRLNIDRTAEGGMSFDVPAKSEISKLMSTILDLPELAGMEENKRSVVVLSGFERLEGILGKPGMKMFLEKIGRQAITSYLLTGYDILPDARKLGGNISGQVLERRADEIFSPGAVRDFIGKRFKDSGKDIPGDLLDSILSVTSGRIELALILSGRMKKAVSQTGAAIEWEGALDEAVNEFLVSSAPSYYALWNQHKDRQQSLLYGLAMDGDKNLYSEYFINRYGFGTATNLQASLRGLAAKSILIKDGKKWGFADPFFRLWIRRQPSSNTTQAV